jgi:hypothetical protein
MDAVPSTTDMSRETFFEDGQGDDPGVTLQQHQSHGMVNN